MDSLRAKRRSLPEEHGCTNDIAGLLLGAVERQTIAGGDLEIGWRRNVFGEVFGQTGRGKTLACQQSERARFPPRSSWAGLSFQRFNGRFRWLLRRQS